MSPPMHAKTGVDFIVNKSAWEKTRLVESEIPDTLSPGKVLFRVDRFAFTSNNISYAGAGDLLGYWRFFPTEEGWGRLPAMGFGDVIASSHDEVAVGTRCFGFFPMSRHLVIEPASDIGAPGLTGGRAIVDGAAHREGLALAYNQYSPVDSDSLYSVDHEDELMLMRGLFMTSFLAEDFLSDSGHSRDAQSIIISSASSKTSIAMAFMVARKKQARAIGLTSASNLDFVKGLGFYDEVHSYDEIEALPQVPSVYVDMAGNSKVTRAVHEHVADQLAFSQRIGATHWHAGGDDGDIPGPSREFFFAPGQIAKRMKDWGGKGFQEKLGSSWKAFEASSSSWLNVQRSYGAQAVEQVYRATLEGRSKPDQGHVISLWESESDASGGQRG